MSRRLALGVAALLSLSAAAAFAATEPGANVTGAWAFETEPYRDECVLKGTMTIRPTAQPDRFVCTFTAYETCPDINVRAEETCVAQLTENGLAIKAAVGEVRPAVSYLPDDFELDAVSTNRMTGMMRSAADAPVTFIRPDPAIS